MKGPGLRLDLDVRRVWRCVACNTERHTPGDVTAVTCHFCQDHPLMTLVEPRRRDRSLGEPLDLVIELHPDDVDAPAFVPVHLREPEEEPADAAEESVEVIDEQVGAEASVEKSADDAAGAEQGVTTSAAVPEPHAAPGDQACEADDTSKAKPRRKKKRRKNRRRKGGGGASSDATK